jgi:hypothetical protein
MSWATSLALLMESIKPELSPNNLFQLSLSPVFSLRVSRVLFLGVLDE